MDGYRPSTYGDSFADVYDDWYAEVSDVDATVARVGSLAAELDGPVLELGIGSGRLALPLVAAGTEVWGIDASAAMVDRMRAKPGGADLPVALGDMAELDLTGLPGGDEQRFAVVLAAYNTLFNLASEADQARCLARCAAVLRPGGRLVVEAFVPAADAPLGGLETRTVGIDHVILTASRREPAAQVVNGQHIEITAAGIRLRPWSIRYATTEQLDALARAVGFELEHRWADWDGAPFDESAHVHVSVYRAQ